MSRKKRHPQRRAAQGKASTKGAHAPRRGLVFVAVALFLGVIAGAGLWAKFGGADQLEPQAPAASSKAAPPTSTVSSGGEPSQPPPDPGAALKAEALKLAHQLVEEYPGEARTLVLLGNAYRGQGNSAAAVEAWQRALAIRPELADVYEGLGQVAFDHGEHRQAVDHWVKLHELAPEHPRVRTKLGEAYITLGEYSKAAEVLRAELERVPDSDQAHFLLGQVHLRLQEFDQAREQYLRAVEINPKHAQAYHGLITVCARTKEPDQAKEYLARFNALKAEELQLQQQHNTEYDDLGTMRSQLVDLLLEAEQIYLTGAERTKAESLLHRATRLDPTNAAPIIELAELRLQAGEMPEALRLFSQALEADPKNVACLLNKGVILSQMKQFREAEQIFLTVNDLAPDLGAGYRELAQVYLRAGVEFERALRLARKALSLDQSAETYAVLSRAWDKNGRRDLALETMARAAELDPANPFYQKMYRLLEETTEP